MEELVLVEKAGGYGVVTLNRPKAMNALSAELRNQLAAAIDALSLIHISEPTRRS